MQPSQSIVLIPFPFVRLRQISAYEACYLIDATSLTGCGWLRIHLRRTRLRLNITALLLRLILGILGLLLLLGVSSLLLLHWLTLVVLCVRTLRLLVIHWDPRCLRLFGLAGHVGGGELCLCGAGAFGGEEDPVEVGGQAEEEVETGGFVS